MGNIILLPETTKNPITLIGQRAGICWGADITDDEKNYKRGLDCIKSNHGRTLEYVNVEMIIDGYSARVVREFYTHIGGSPTRLQASTRYIDYTKDGGFDYVIPKSIQNHPTALVRYQTLMERINKVCIELEKEFGIPREDSAMCLPLSMSTKIVDKRNLRNLMDMSRNRMCTRAYWEYRQLFKDICNALSEISDEWKWIVDNLFMPKCEQLGYCPENKSCGRKEKRQ
jgi:thymidylate synthase (FAD)